MKHAVTMNVVLFIEVFDFPKKIVIRIKQDYNLVLWLYFQDGRQVARVEIFFLSNIINEVISFCILAAGFNLPAIIKNKGQFVFSLPVPSVPHHWRKGFIPFNKETYTHHHLSRVSCEKFDQLGLIYFTETFKLKLT